MEGSPLPRDLLISLPLALGFIALRKIFERCIAFPLSRLLGVKDKMRLSASPAPNLETFYAKRSRLPAQNELSILMKQSGLSQKEIETWFRHRRNQDRPSNTKKFCEASWRHLGFGNRKIAGWDILNKILKNRLFTTLLPFFCLDSPTALTTSASAPWSYSYMTPQTFFWSQQKCSIMQAGKKTCDSLFVVFAAVFLVTRLVVFPSKIIYTTLILSMEVFQPFAGYYFFNFLLLVLQFLHIFWAWLILRMIYKFLFLGKLDKDERSDDDESEADEEETDGDEEEDQASWRKRRVVLDSKLAMMTSSCVLNNLSNQRFNVSSRTPKAR